MCMCILCAYSCKLISVMIFACPIGQRGGYDEEAHSPSSVTKEASQEDDVMGEQVVPDMDRRSATKMKALLRDEVLINAQKFKTQVHV